MKTTNIISLPLVFLALSGCLPIHWSGHPAQVTGVTSGVGPDPARPVLSENEVKPFIAKMPLTYDEHTKAARLYLDLADKYRKEAASHRAMKQLYKNNDPTMADHCDRLSLQLSTLADQCEAVAREYEKKAETLKGLKK